MSKTEPSAAELQELDSAATRIREFAIEDWTSPWVRTSLEDIAEQLERGEMSAGFAADRVRKVMDTIYNGNEEKSPNGLTPRQRSELVDELSVVVYDLTEIHSDSVSDTEQQ